MILYGVPLSPFVRKTMFMLYELDLSFEQIMIVPQGDDSAFREASPLGRIPGFADGDIKLSDSSAICYYVARRHDSDLIPCHDPLALARIVGFDKYADEDLAPAVFEPLVERVVKRVRFGEAADEATVATALAEKMPPVFDHLDRQLVSDGDWFAGRDFSFADIALGAHMANLPLAGIELDADRWPALGRWCERLSERPAFNRMYEAARTFGG